MNNVDKLLSDTADFLEAQIAADQDLAQDLHMLFAAGQNPSIVRMMSGFLGTELYIVMGTPTDAHH